MVLIRSDDYEVFAAARNRNGAIEEWSPISWSVNNRCVAEETLLIR